MKSKIGIIFIVIIMINTCPAFSISLIDRGFPDAESKIIAEDHDRDIQKDHVQYTEKMASNERRVSSFGFHNTQKNVDISDSTDLNTLNKQSVNYQAIKDEADKLHSQNEANINKCYSILNEAKENKIKLDNDYEDAKQRKDSAESKLYEYYDHTGGNDTEYENLKKEEQKALDDMDSIDRKKNKIICLIADSEDQIKHFEDIQSSLNQLRNINQQNAPVLIADFKNSVSKLETSTKSSNIDSASLNYDIIGEIYAKEDVASFNSAEIKQCSYQDLKPNNIIQLKSSPTSYSYALYQGTVLNGNEYFVKYANDNGEKTVSLDDFRKEFTGNVVEYDHKNGSPLNIPNSSIEFYKDFLDESKAAQLKEEIYQIESKNIDAMAWNMAVTAMSATGGLVLGTVVLGVIANGAPILTGLGTALAAEAAATMGVVSVSAATVGAAAAPSLAVPILNLIVVGVIAVVAAAVVTTVIVSTVLYAAYSHQALDAKKQLNQKDNNSFLPRHEL